MALLERVSIVYCGACGMPLEYCEYGPDYESHCNPWLKKNHPDLFRQYKRRIEGGGDEEDNDEERPPRPENPWTVGERLTAFYEKYEPGKVDNVPSLLEKYEGKEEKLFMALVKKYGAEPDDPYNDYDSDEDDETETLEAVGALTIGGKKKRRGVGAKKAAKVDTRIVIQKITRNRRKATTVVIGMDTVPGIKLKDVSKAFSKRFAGSSSVKDNVQGGKEVIVQGDHMDAVAQMIVKQFGVSGDSVYLDIDGEYVPFVK